MADEGDLIFVLIFGSLAFAYAVLFYVCDTEFRQNFQAGSHSYADDHVDNVQKRIDSAKYQFNQLAEKFERMNFKGAAVMGKFQATSLDLEPEVMPEQKAEPEVARSTSIAVIEV